MKATENEIPISPAMRAYASYREFCERVGTPCPSFEDYSFMTRGLTLVPTQGGIEIRDKQHRMANE
jgi:hypothetical protein